MRRGGFCIGDPHFWRRGETLLEIIGYKQQYFHYKPEREPPQQPL